MAQNGKGCRAHRTQGRLDMGQKQAARRKADKKRDYSRLETLEELRGHAERDKSLPAGLRDLLKDNELWALYKPTGHEINMLRDIFSPLGKGNKQAYREALRVIREFMHSF